MPNIILINNDKLALIFEFTRKVKTADYRLLFSAEKANRRQYFCYIEVDCRFDGKTKSRYFEIILISYKIVHIEAV